MTYNSHKFTPVIPSPSFYSPFPSQDPRYRRDEEEYYYKLRKWKDEQINSEIECKHNLLDKSSINDLIL